jgi:hypothetical protein
MGTLVQREITKMDIKLYMGLVKEQIGAMPSLTRRDGSLGHRGVVGAVSEDDDVLGEPDGETGGDDGVGWMGQVISIYPYVPSHLMIQGRFD